MRVICNTVGEFIEDLNIQIEDSDGIDCVLERSVRTSIIQKPTENEIKKQIIFQASAVVATLDGEGQYLLEVGVLCGFDYYGGEQDYEGTEKAEGLKKELKEFCDKVGIRIRPGVIDL